MAPPSALYDRLQDIKADHEWIQGSNDFFIPVDAIQTSITEKTVAEELRHTIPPDRLQPDQVSHYSQVICNTTKRIFSLLLCINKVVSICDFVDEGITDADLPFVRLYPNSHAGNSGKISKWSLSRVSHSNCQKLSHEGCCISSMACWNQKAIMDICREQWSVLAPEFKRIEGKIPHHNLDNNTIFPYIEDNQGVQGRSGGYSHVWGIRIHPAHQDVYSFGSTALPPLLAVKRPFSTDRRDFDREIDMLSELAVRNHSFLVKLLFTYEYKSQYHLVFPFANANLREYWSNTGVPHWNKDTYLWFMKQTQGIASGLNAIHNFESKRPYGNEKTRDNLKSKAGNLLTTQVQEQKYGRHGDIKPENILWFNELPEHGREGVLQIADLGLGRFHRFESRSKVDPKTVNGSPTYTPPEIELQLPVSRAYDIWSLGCVFLEFITWLLVGPHQIMAFSNYRGVTGQDGINDDTFFTLNNSEGGRKSAVVREEVLQWIAQLRQEQRCSKMIQEILNLVEIKMLVVDSQTRIKSKDLVASLQRISDKAEIDLEYLLGPGPHQNGEAGVKLPSQNLDHHDDDDANGHYSPNGQDGPVFNVEYYD